MKGVICSINSDVNIIDITHEISPFDIRESAIAVGTYFGFFPAGTIHVCVVDPGVGSGRRPIIVSAGGYHFVGPDNGIFSEVYRNLKSVEVREITSEKYLIKKDSTTFQGRDIFAPVAAWLSMGVPASDFGGIINDFRHFTLPSSRITGNRVEGEILYSDHFGNAITNISEDDIKKAGGGPLYAEVRGLRIPFAGHYAENDGKGLSFLINSNNLIEIFIFKSSASATYGLEPGNPVIVVTD